jgi:DNA-directed RNA polymerase subunit beta'
MQQLDSAWRALESASATKAQRLREAKDEQDYARGVTDANAWCGEVEQALANGSIRLHSAVFARVPAPTDANPKRLDTILTTPGRMMMGALLPRDPRTPFSLVNRMLTKKNISDVIDAVYRHCGQKESVIFADRLMGLGFRQAAKAGISFGKDDMVIPDSKPEMIANDIKNAMDDVADARTVDARVAAQSRLDGLRQLQGALVN